MALNKQKGNMYNFVTHTLTCLVGTCPHRCTYCYVNDLKLKYPVLAKKYSGEPRLVESDLQRNLGKDKTIFICSTHDLFAEAVPDELVLAVLQHCNKFDNEYLFQSKNPARFSNFDFPDKTILGITLETNRDYGVSHAPIPFDRALDFQAHYLKMISIEPVMDFDLSEFVDMIAVLAPKFISIGADSKGHNLPEPSGEKVKALIAALEEFTEVRPKKNLQRLMG